jgi:hypothetical protein
MCSLVPAAMLLQRLIWGGIVAIRLSGKRKRKLGARCAQGRMKLGRWQVKIECATQKGKMALGVKPYNLEDDEVHPLDEREKILGLTRGRAVKNTL